MTKRTRKRKTKRNRKRKSKTIAMLLHEKTHCRDLCDLASLCGFASRSFAREREKHIWAFIKEEAGQSTVEFVVIFCALLAMIVAFIAFFSAGVDGVFMHLAAIAASHASGISVIGMMQDVLLY